MTLGCNSNCSCDADFYSPVCGSDEKNYFNPCFAGCHHLSSNSTNKKVRLDVRCSPFPDNNKNFKIFQNDAHIQIAPTPRVHKSLPHWKPRTCNYTIINTMPHHHRHSTPCHTIIDTMHATDAPCHTIIDTMHPTDAPPTASSSTPCHWRTCDHTIINATDAPATPPSLTPNRCHHSTGMFVECGEVTIINFLNYDTHLSFNQVFLDCQCVTDDVRTATVGLCRKPCPVIYLYLAVLFVTSFVTSMMIVPMMTILLRYTIIHLY